ncbi:hypothetical protein [Atlantibacter hermannii]|uniref:Uncharacterized protein n=1 Tax=Atlantibacter hermannii NBRC 105704 TaxID=1115512 RepID=H5UWI0_ATLHE|nr:hypothetical protein [Atlantibacter hermannii]QPS90198.1 hypothetical protein I6G45_11545 [Atlantibacter hermannii]GAB50261.1 hypothetical protein EH105704_01_02680 [Atlantibacter hermannii NBRC 105704]VDZ72966.1 Uncharacterised protein [Atlantibacter hermannii]
MNEDFFIKALQSIDEILSDDFEAKKKITTRKVLDSNNLADWDRAEEFYDEIRQDLSDIPKIANNLQKSERIVNRVKEHVFIRDHEIVIDDLVEIRRLDADPEIVNVWSRLCEGDHVESDVKLFEHEQLESIIEIRQKVSQTVAHRQTVLLGYNWNPDEAYDGDSSTNPDD